MFTALKDFFIGILITVGVMSAPVITPQQMPLDAPSVIVQKQVIKDIQTEDEQAPIQEAVTTSLAQSAPIVEQSAQRVIPVTVIEDTLDTEGEPEVVLEMQNARCGAINGVKVTGEPSNNLCSIGEAGVVTKDGNAYVWECEGVAGGTDQSCRAPIMTDAVCGSLANTIVPKNYDKDNLCLVGLYSNFSENGSQMSWKCSGEHDGEDLTCHAIKASTQSDMQSVQPTAQKVSGVCGTDQGKITSEKPKNNLCGSGTPSSVGLNLSGTSYLWTCSGSDGGVSAQCSAPYQVSSEQNDMEPCIPQTSGGFNPLLPSACH